MKNRIVIVVGLLVLVTSMLMACTPAQNEYNKQSDQLARYQRTQPAPVLNFSNTRQAVIERINRWNDPSKISYVYLVSFGRVMAFYTVKGSVESKRSYLSPTSDSLPDVDGTFGENSDAVFFFTTDNVYVEWKGDYMWVDQPLKLATQPELIYTAPLK